MAQTVSEVLTAATDSVTLINEVNAGTWDVEGMEQSEINDSTKKRRPLGNRFSVCTC
jgi:hypothetical protein